MALAEYGPFAKSSALPFDPKLNASHSVGASAVRSSALKADLRIVCRCSSGRERIRLKAMGGTVSQQAKARNHPSYRVRIAAASAMAPLSNHLPALASSRSNARLASTKKTRAQMKQARYIGSLSAVVWT